MDHLFKRIEDLFTNPSPTSILVVIVMIVCTAVIAGLGSYAKKKFEWLADKESFREMIETEIGKSEATKKIETLYSERIEFNKTKGQLEALEQQFTATLEQQRALTEQNTRIQQEIQGAFTEAIEKYKWTLQVDLEFKRSVMAPRLNAYCELWKRLEPLAASRDGDLASEKRDELRAELRSWYHVQAGGLMLSPKAFDAYIQAVRFLARDPYLPEMTRKSVSLLRTQMKEDLGVYTPEEARTPFRNQFDNPIISTPRTPPSKELKAPDGAPAAIDGLQ